MNAASWSAVASGVAAIATAGLALATFWMARKTKTMAEATGLVAQETKAVGAATLKEAKAVEQQANQAEKQIELSASALRLNIQPWLIWDYSRKLHLRTHIGPFIVQQDTTLGTVFGGFVIKNIGNGIAILDMQKSLIYAKNGPIPYEGVHPDTDSHLLAPNETAAVNFEIPVRKAADQQMVTLLEVVGPGPELLTVEISYHDILGNWGGSAKFRAYHESPQADWRVYEVEYHLPDNRVVVA